jgi:hypothetical protein
MLRPSRAERRRRAADWSSVSLKVIAMTLRYQIDTSLRRMDQDGIAIASSAVMAHPPDKTCAVCGRRIEWRAKWERDWPNIRHCGQRCRRTRLDETDSAFEDAILALLASRARAATICPSEAARQVGDMGTESMERARRAARRLVAAGRVEITQKGQVVDPSTARGPIRIRLA